jgi:hypothetical protein
MTKRVDRWMTELDDVTAGAQDARTQLGNLKTWLKSVLAEIDADLEDVRARHVGGGEPPRPSR